MARVLFVVINPVHHGAALIEDGVRDVTTAVDIGSEVLAIRYPAPAVGLPPSYRFATDGLLLRYIAGGGERYTSGLALSYGSMLAEVSSRGPVIGLLPGYVDVLFPSVDRAPLGKTMANQVLRIEGIVGNADDPALHQALHRLKHSQRVEYIALGSDDLLRRRLRVMTDKGNECAIALCRQEKLFDGAVLLLDDSRAVIVRATASAWLVLQPLDTAAAIELGYCR